jgi:FixJ family two-component response regulator
VAARPLVCVVDDDESVRESLPDLLHELGYEAEAFATALAFLASGIADESRCLILDIAMPGMSGPDLQQELRLHHPRLPVIFIAGTAEDCGRNRVVALGAVDCLVKPFSEQLLRAALHKAFRGKQWENT